MPRADAERRHAAGVVTFTLGDRPITAREIASFVNGAETVYGVLLCLLWLERDAFRTSPGHRDDFYFFARDMEEQFSLGSQIDWQSFSHHLEWKRRFGPDQAWLFSVLGKLYERGPSEYEDSKERIFLLRAVQYRSPGFISFEGLGEIVRQFRELIKDFWWRNEHERQQAKLKRTESEQFIDMKDLELAYAKEYRSCILPMPRLF